jgi:acyl-CoA synthetase (AMP-forming)/AMP-acid ligase II
MRVIRSPHPDISIPDSTLTEFVLDATAGRVHEIALVDGPTGRSLTFGELRRGVRRVAAGLAKLGICKGDVVALWAPNSPEFAVVFLAIIRLGAIVTPANTAYTSKELSCQIANSRAKLVVTTAALAAAARTAIQQSGLEVGLLTLDEAEGATSIASVACDTDPPEVVIDAAKDLAVLPYSSGTTGLPKGVMLTHRNLVANLRQLESVDRESQTPLVGVLPFFHIYGLVVVLLYGIMRGTTVVALPRFELESFLKMLQDWNIGVAHIVPPIALVLAKHPAVDNYRLSRLKWLFSGAAPLCAEIAEDVRKRLNVAIRQGYGLTEASPVAFYTRADANRPGKSGQLLPNTECRIVDPETGRDVAAGQRGEVWIRGPQVMRGYFRNVEATAQTIVAQGWLRTGDIGVIDDDGYLTLVDRLKELIKVKGFQVAPAELEAVLLQHPGIADAAVVPVPDPEAGEVPKAIVVARGTLAADEVIAFVNSAVAHYKRIRHVAFVEAIPKSASGKILRRVLVERERAGLPT